MDKSLQQYWDNRAQRYGAQSAHYMDAVRDWYSFAIRMRSFLTYIKLDPQARILDVGAGTGLWSIPLAKKGYAVTASDFSKEILDVLTREAAAQGVDVPVYHGELFDLKEQHYDCVLFVTSLQHIFVSNTITSVLDHVRSILNPGGRAVIIDYIPRRIPSYQTTLAYKKAIRRDVFLDEVARAHFTVRQERGINLIDMKFIHYWDTLARQRFESVRSAVMKLTYAIDIACANRFFGKPLAKYRLFELTPR